MTMTPTGGIKEIIAVIPPKGNHYPFRLQAINTALKNTPDSPVLPFLQALVSAQNVTYSALEKHYTTHHFQDEEPFIVMDEEIVRRFQNAGITFLTELHSILEKTESMQYAAVITTLETLKDELHNEAKATQYFKEVLALNLEAISAEKRLFVLAIMQTTLHFEAAHLTVDKQYILKNRELCPCCKMPAISSVLDNTEDGLRYLYCSFCETKWHVVRSQCTECVSNKSLFQSKIEELESPMSAETCDECHTYLKFLDRTKKIMTDPFIEDLLTLPLAIKLHSDEYKTHGFNPYLV